MKKFPLKLQPLLKFVSHACLAGLGFLILTAIAVFGQAPSGPAGTPAQGGTVPAVTPQYDKDGALIRPKDFYTWVFVGSSIGLSYSKDSDPNGPGMFHNVYTQPE